MTPEQRNRLFILFTGHGAETLTPEEHSELQDFLRADSEARRLWFVHQDVAAGVRALHDRTSAPAPVGTSRSPRWLSWRRLLAAGAALIAVLALLFTRQPESVVVQVVHTEQASLAGHGDLLRVGEEFAARELKLDRGMLRLRLRNGVLLDLHAPLQATLDSAMRMHLVSGRLNADVGRDGKGFTVVTDAGEIVDLGTRFGVETEPQGESRVAVFSGEVKVRTTKSGGEFTTLQTGEAVRFTALAEMRSWQQVALAADAAGIGQSQAVGVIEAVSDNRGDERLHPFYGVMRHGVQPRAQVYVDRLRPRLAPNAGDTIPEWLIGADLILTYQRFRNRENYALTLTLNQAATVFVMLPEGRVPPKWLADGFVNTGARVAVGPMNEGEVETRKRAADEPPTPRRMLAIWRADVAAGTQVLGGIRDDQSPDKVRVSYVVAVKPLHPEH